jgi:hypothetical protein
MSDLTQLPKSDILIIHGYAPATSVPAAKRQERPFPPTFASSTLATNTATHKPNHTLITGGPLLDRVQILTTPIITGLLVTFGLFIPIAVLGISALVGIQVPPRMLEIGKGLVVGRERKEQ